GAGSSAIRAVARAASLHGLRQPLEHEHRRVPVDACIRDALAVHEWPATNEVLTSRNEVALDHHAADARLTRFELPGDRVEHGWLILIALAAVAVTRVDHDAGIEAGGRDRFARGSDARRVVVRRFSSAKDDVTVRISSRRCNGAAPLLGD